MGAPLRPNGWSNATKRVLEESCDKTGADSPREQGLFSDRPCFDHQRVMRDYAQDPVRLNALRHMGCV
jgi:hypothetical protein